MAGSVPRDAVAGRGDTSMFDAGAERLLRDDPRIERGRIFHDDGLKIGGKVFAFPRHGEVVLKLPATRVQELVASEAGSPFDAGKGRPMREWVTVRPVSEAECAAYLAEARDFLAGLTQLE
jgi:hypothetical protein